jgi:hypothetical protein
MSVFRVRASWSRLVVAAVAAAAAWGGVVGCGQVSDETKNAAVDAICPKINVDPGKIEHDPAAARVVALVVRDLAPDEDIRDVANQVAQDPTVVNPRVKLANWVDEKCGR